MSAKRVLIPYDFVQNEIQNAVIQVLATDPVSPINGQIWVNSTSWVLKVRLNGVTIQLGRLDQTSAPTASIDLNGQRVTNGADPVSAQDLATMQWVSNLLSSQISGQDWKAAVKVATTAALPSNSYNSGAQTLTATANGALTVDGIGLANGDGVLVKNEATGQNNGVFTVTNAGSAGAPWVLTRRSDANISAKVNNGMTVPVLSGTINADTLWVQTADNVILDTTPLAFAQVGSSGATYTAGTGLTLIGNQFSLNTPVPIANGGTGAASAAAARTALGVVQKYIATGPNSGGTSWVVTHNLGTMDVVYMIRDAVTNDEVIVAPTATDANTMTFGFGSAVSANAYKVTIIG